METAQKVWEGKPRKASEDFMKSGTVLFGSITVDVCVVCLSRLSKVT